VYGVGIRVMMVVRVMVIILVMMMVSVCGDSLDDEGGVVSRGIGCLIWFICVFVCFCGFVILFGGIVCIC